MQKLVLCAALLGAAPFLSGCGDDCAGCDIPAGPPPPPRPACVTGVAAPADSPAVIVGLGETPESFVPLTEGAVVERVNGAQGGQHIDVAARVHADRLVDARFSFEPGDFPSTRVDAEPCANGWVQVVGRLFSPPSGEPTIVVEVMEGETVLVTDQVTVQVP